ncbi:hypothetical protein JW710_00305 [Candidatus Dojkabacteria bacterium]|nr:hypothetical protein [Candidatus Dojkabacteria bacterium]
MKVTYLKKIVDSEEAVGFVESLIAILIVGVASVALLSISAAVVREAKRNEIRDARTQYAVEGMEKVRWIAEVDDIPGPGYYCLTDDDGCDGEGYLKLIEGERCSENNDGSGECGRLPLSTGSEFFYREIYIEDADSGSVKFEVLVGELRRPSSTKSESSIVGHIGGLRDYTPEESLCHSDGTARTTGWGENLYDCEGENKRCVDGECVTCDGVLFDDGCGGCAGQGGKACWYVGSASCNSVCSVAGSSCVNPPDASHHWNAKDGLFSAFGYSGCTINSSTFPNCPGIVKETQKIYYCSTGAEIREPIDRYFRNISIDDPIDLPSTLCSLEGVKKRTVCYKLSSGAYSGCSTYRNLGNDVIDRPPLKILVDYEFSRLCVCEH